MTAMVSEVPKTFVFEVNVHCRGCQKKLDRKLTKLGGVSSVIIELDQNRVTVSGTVDPNVIIAILAKAGRRAKLLSEQPAPAGPVQPSPERTATSTPRSDQQDQHQRCTTPTPTPPEGPATSPLRKTPPPERTARSPPRRDQQDKHQPRRTPTPPKISATSPPRKSPPPQQPASATTAGPPPPAHQGHHHDPNFNNLGSFQQAYRNCNCCNNDCPMAQFQQLAQFKNVRHMELTHTYGMKVKLTFDGQHDDGHSHCNHALDNSCRHGSHGHEHNFTYPVSPSPRRQSTSPSMGQWMRNPNQHDEMTTYFTGESNNVCSIL